MLLVLFANLSNKLSSHFSILRQLNEKISTRKSRKSSLLQFWWQKWHSYNEKKTIHFETSWKAICEIPLFPRPFSCHLLYLLWRKLAKRLSKVSFGINFTLLFGPKGPKKPRKSKIWTETNRLIGWYEMRR